MKAKWIPVISILAALIIGPCAMHLAQGQAVPQRTIIVPYPSQLPQWAHARGSSGVDSNDTAPDPNAMCWQDYLDSTYYDFNPSIDHYSLAFLAYGDGDGDGDPNGGSIDVNCYIVTQYGSWEQIGSFTATVGELEATHQPWDGTAINSGSVDANSSWKFVEGPFTTALSDDYWSDANDLEGATNTIGRFNFYSHGAYGLIVLINDINSITTVYPLVMPR